MITFERTGTEILISTWILKEKPDRNKVVGRRQVQLTSQRITKRIQAPLLVTYQSIQLN